MLQYRDPKTTPIISISQFCTDEFTRFFPILYPKFNITKILHTSELNESIYKTKFNIKPIVLGNWSGFLKGKPVIEQLKKHKSIYTFKQLNIHYNKNYKSYTQYNLAKQKIYCDADIFLQLSLSEGFGYATLDAFLCGNVIVATDVGGTYKDIPEDCYVKLDHTKINDINYLLQKLQYAWDHKEELSKRSREFYITHLNMKQWQTQMKEFIQKL